MIEIFTIAFLSASIVVTSSKITELTKKVDYLEGELFQLRQDLTKQTQLRYGMRSLMDLQNEAISKIYSKLEL